MFFTKIVIVIMLTCASLADEPKTKDRCSALTKCSECTVEALERGKEADEEGGGGEDGGACHWSLERQTCLPRTTASTTSTMVVRRPADCPRFTVVHNHAIFGEKFTYSVNVTNDGKADFVTYLVRVGFTCLMNDGSRLAGRMDGNAIECEPVVRKGGSAFVDGFDGEPSMLVMHFYIVFGEDNSTLRLDDDADYYVAFYNRDCNEYGGYDDGCVNCTWTTDDSRYFVKRCSIRNQCAGPFEFYDRRLVKGVDKHLSGWVNGVRAMCEQAITVEWFEPTEVPWTVDSVAMKVAVRNHGILADGATVRVTVAGHECALPLTSPDDANVLTCTVSAGSAAGRQGPVRVVYTTHQQLAVESDQRFRYATPYVTGVVGPSCGPLTGDTQLTLTGTEFKASRTARVFIVWEDDEPAPCRVVKLARDHILCSTAPRPVPTGPGRVRVDFDASLSSFAPGPGFAYTVTPRPAAGQRLSGIASGGTSFTVRFDGLQCLDNSLVTFSVLSQRTECRVERETIVCESPRIVEHKEVVEPAKLIASFECGFALWFAGDTVFQPCPEHGYAVYADPQFADFELIGNTVIIYGRGELGRGFRTDDVSVTLRDKHWQDECSVWWIGPDRIKCVASTQVMARSERGLLEVLVTVGHAATVSVPARRRREGDALTGVDRTWFGFFADNAAMVTVVVLSVATLMALGYAMALLLQKKWTDASATGTDDSELTSSQSPVADGIPSNNTITHL